ncbi:MAG: hypothetical protein KDM63_10825, partial [Verrucomicrobiae bacterium]|nr:hypothetical protein [Verrucomicrobiae bacterium]
MRHFFTTIRLSLADLWNERVLTACLLLSMGAILGPLLLLFGLKLGVIETMRGRLLRDPATREIFPKDIQNVPFSDDWFTSMETRPDVEFVIPRLDVSGDLKVRLAIGEAKDHSVTAVCHVTANGDPRMRKLGLKVPGKGEVVISSTVADKLEIGPGDTLTAVVDRGGLYSRMESVGAQLRVAGVLAQGDALSDQAWLPLEFVRAVKDYRSYVSVPEFGWEGREEEIAPVFDSILTLSATAPEPAELAELVGKPPGLIDTESVGLEFLLAMTGLKFADTHEDAPSAILWRARNNTIPKDSVGELANRLSEIGLRAMFYPLIDSLNVALTASTGSGSIEFVGLHVLEEIAPSGHSQDAELDNLRRSLSSQWDPTISKLNPPAESGDPPPVPTKEKSMKDPDPAMPGFPEAGYVSNLSPSGANAPPATHGSVPSSPELRAVPIEKSGDIYVEVEGVESRPLSPGIGAFPDSSNLSLQQADQTLVDLPTDVANPGVSNEPSLTGGGRLVAVSSESPLPSGKAILSFAGMEGKWDIPVQIVKREGIPKGVAVTHAEFGGILRRALSEPIVFDSDSDGFRRKGEGYRDFRLFASRLEDVAPLVKEFEDRGIRMNHSAERISEILQLDEHLTRLFWLIATAAVVAGFFGLVASLFASVERKRRDLGVLQ